MKNGIIGGIVTLVIVGGLFSLFNNHPTRDEKRLSGQEDSFDIERSYTEYGDKDCADFSSQREAQEFFEEQGGPDKDFHNLDRDEDGIACESLK